MTAAQHPSRNLDGIAATLSSSSARQWWKIDHRLVDLPRSAGTLTPARGGAITQWPGT